MHEKLLEELAQFHSYTQAIGDLMRQAFALGPDQSSGRDATGRVVVTLQRSGELSDLRIDPTWANDIARADLGNAICQAIKDAERANLQAISEATAANGIVERLDALKIEDCAPTVFNAPEPSRFPTVGMNHLANEILDAMDTQADSIDATTFTGTCETADELFASVTLASNGISSCVVGLPWGIDSSAESIAAVVRDAYADAYNTRYTSTASSTRNPLEGLAGDAIQILANLQLDNLRRTQ
ncbi:Uncharacterised protein [Nocardia farcinica]|uniref:YbaB/EbfC DNA-binding family protein n=1 Tax=Nocardia farcinica TaxID=37329 RepID=A0A449H3D7_NOCFR|nr:hypothetical protein [Nocardia farcinica]VFA92508.1 Uncharacterised protein [Nocardia farcinica]